MKLRPRTVRRLSILSLLCALIVAGVFVRSAVRTHQITKSLDRARHVGLAAHRDDRHQIAVAKLGYFLSHRPEDLEVMLAYAHASASQEDAGLSDRTEAAGWFERVLEREPENRQALEGLLMVYRQTGQPALCEDVAIHLLAMNPDHVNALACRAGAALADGRRDAAAECLTKLAMIEPQRVRWRRALTEIRFDAGVSADRIVEECGLDAYLAWIDSLHVRGQSRHALDAAAALHRTGTDWPPEVHVALARAWLTDGEDDRPVGLVHVGTGDAMSLIEFLTIVNADHPRHPGVIGLLIDALMTAGAIDRVNETIEQILAADDIELPLLRMLLDGSRKWRLGWEGRLASYSEKRYGASSLTESSPFAKGIR